MHEELSRLAAWFRLAYSAVFLVAISQLAGIPGLLSTPEIGGFTTEQLAGQALLKVDDLPRHLVRRRSSSSGSTWRSPATSPSGRASSRG